MKGWRIGFFVVCTLMCGSAVWAADEPPPPWWVARSLSVPHISLPPLECPGAPGSVAVMLPEAVQPAPADGPAPIVVAPLPRVGFERWRRLQPYSVSRDPVTVYLLQDE